MFRSKKFFIVFLLVSLFSFLVYYTTYKPYLGCDDAYIYFVYAKNLVRGYGLVYNPGGEKVEGFTSLLWMLIVSLAYLVSSHFQLLLIALNVLLVSYSLYRIVFFIDKYYSSHSGKIISFNSLFFLLILLIIKGFLDWTIFSLLETGLWCSLLLLLSVYLLEVALEEEKTTRQKNIFSILIGLLIITRPESFLWGLVLIFAYGALVYIQHADLKKALRIIAGPFIVYLATIICLILFRIYYFGYPLPNTYYAKVSSDKLYNVKEGLIYILKFIFVYPFYFLPVAVSLIYMGILLKKLTGRKKEKISFDHYTVALYLNAFLIFISLIIPMVNGGDHFSLFRLFQPVVPLFILPFFNPAFINHVRSIIIDPKRNWKISAVFIVMLLPFLYLINMPKYIANVEKVPYKVSLLNDFSFAEKYKQESLQLNNFFNFTPKPSIGRIWAGGYAYAYDGETIDLMGLNNTVMAHAQARKIGLKNHAAFNKEAFYKLHPALLNGTIVSDTAGFVMPENKPDFERSFDYDVFKGIYKDEKFINQYSPVLITGTGKPFTYFTYLRNDYADTLKKHNLNVTVLKRK